MKEILWMRLLLKVVGFGQAERTLIYEVNLGPMALAKNTGYQTPNEHTIFASILFGTCGDVGLKYYLTKDSST
ncbi:hypothetical protein GN958_ATG01168 [Phytophthora infestans]|uniref:Uncharacterized protein n=1 Tax=Phytophthora infestans TaxID=4787 RepID=A0A8S9V9I9_PHYIN|nr:hypothetical protein GN958_ATG01168 [Phytophthora infestans]